MGLAPCKEVLIPSSQVTFPTGTNRDYYPRVSSAPLDYLQAGRLDPSRHYSGAISTKSRPRVICLFEPPWKALSNSNG